MEINMELSEYIEKHYNGNRAEFARSQGVSRQLVNKWLTSGWIVLEGKFYSPRQELKK